MTSIRECRRAGRTAENAWSACRAGVRRRLLHGCVRTGCAAHSGFAGRRIRRFQSFAEISTEPGPHFGLDLEGLRHGLLPSVKRYGDMINHRLLKAAVIREAIARPQEDITSKWRNAVA